MSFGIWELVVILLIVGVLFGFGKLRNLGPDLGHAIKGLRNALRDDRPPENEQGQSTPPQDEKKP
ncbi:MAG: twin-arginine translocase TatA/TatE family subunit [Gammaproteobacteria bacterium]|nr:twin-arginine translocase TatA/TatE family subunit [Gammaproteobacteria bacterium]